MVNFQWVLFSLNFEALHFMLNILSYWGCLKFVFIKIFIKLKNQYSFGFDEPIKIDHQLQFLPVGRLKYFRLSSKLLKAQFFVLDSSCGNKFGCCLSYSMSHIDNRQLLKNYMLDFYKTCIYFFTGHKFVHTLNKFFIWVIFWVFPYKNIYYM